MNRSIKMKRNSENGKKDIKRKRARKVVKRSTHLLKTKAVCLGRLALAQLILGHHQFAKAPSTPFTQQCQARPKLHASRERGLGLAIFSYALEWFET